ncbi:MAG TPA: hypothetical protein VGG14_06070 [Candidatus Sulfotelmatobacter sp.]
MLVSIGCVVIFLASPLAAQSKRLWVLRAPGAAVEYDPATFTEKHSVKVPDEAVTSPHNLSVNALGQMLFAPQVDLPLSEDDAASGKKVWFWDGHAVVSLTRDVSRTVGSVGSNLAISETTAIPFLAVDGEHIYWFSNQARRLQRDGVDLSTKTIWSAWRTDLAGAKHEEMVSTTLPECSCPTGGCEETCPYGQVWVPKDGVGSFFLLTMFVSGQDHPTYKSTSLYQENGGKWAATSISPPLQRVLDAANPNAILEAIPDTGCCGWLNKSDDQTLLHVGGGILTVFDERAAYKNPDYDVSFYTSNGKLSPGLENVAYTIVATTAANKPIQLADEGQANPVESEHIRKALLELPAVEVKTTEETPRRVAFLPHAALVDWISDKEILIVEQHLLVGYNVATGARRKSTIRVEDAEHVFLR